VSTATDTVEDNSLGVAGTTNVINISGNAYNGATATLSPDPITFTSQPVGTPTAATAVQFGIFLNPLLTIESVAITGPNASSFSLSAAATSPCTVGGTIPNGGGDCNLGVVFDPATGGPISATLTITWQAGGVTYSLSAPLSGTGAQATPPATPVIYPASNTYNAPVAVAITDTDASATIDYSTDGTTPSLAYTAPFTVSQTATVMTFATEGPGNNSSTINSTYTIQPYLSFNPAAVGEASASAQTLTALFSFAGSTTPTAALHYGLDYSTGSVACTSPTTGIETCSVPVTFIPTLPGPRKDALILSSGGSTIATVYLGGTGNAPLALIQPGVVTNPVSSFPDYVYNSTVDENGTVYFLTGSAGTVYSLTKSGTPTALPITGLGNPTEIAVDGAGILYVAPNSGSEAYLITFDPQTGTQGTISMVPPAPFQQCNTGYGPYYDFVGVAVDDLGNIYGLEGSCQEVIELQANGTITVTALNPNVGQIGTIAVDASANGNPPNIFASGNNKIDEITYQGQSAINTTGATNIAVDAAATIYATRYSADGYQVAELASSDYSIPQAGLDGGTNGEIVDPLGLGLDSDGTLYLGNYQDLDKVDRTQGAIAFGGQQTGVASSAQNISIYNGGNQPLTVSNIVLSGASSGFAMSAASTNSCINGNNFATVAVGALCQISVIMTPPHAGNFTGSITFTTNSDNHSGSSAVVALSGYVNGIYITVSPDPVAFGNQVTGTTSAVMTATVTNNGFLYSAGVNGPSEVQADNAFTPTLGACADASLAVGQSCKLSVTFAPSLQQPYNDTITFSAFSSGGGPDITTTFGVTGTGIAPALTPQAITFTQPTSPITWSSSLTVALVATGGASGNPVVFTIDGTSTGTGSISGSTLSITTPGTFVIDANQAGNASYSAAPQVQRSLVVNKAPQTINFTAPTSPLIYTTGLTIPLVATGGASGNAVVFTIDASSTATGSISGSTLTVTSTGKLVINANQTGNTDYLAATQVQQTVTVNAPSPQTITFAQPATPISYAPSLTVTLVASGGASGNPVVFTIDGASTGTGSISGSTLSITTPGTFVIDANQAGNSSYSAAPQVQRSLVVNKASQTINFTAPTSPVIYTSGLTISLTATGGSSGNAVVFAIDSSSTATGSISGSTLTVTSTGKLVINANQAGNTDYLAATQVQQTVQVNSPSAQAISFAQPTSPITWSSSLTVGLVATGGASGNPVVFTIDGASAGTGSISGSTLSITTPGTFVIDANQTGNASYSAAPQVQRTLVVNQAPQSINFTQPTSPVTYTSGLTISLTATGGASGKPIVFTLDASSTASASISGSTVTVTSAGNVVINANQAGNPDYSAAPQVQRTVLVNPPPADFTISAAPRSQTVSSGSTATYNVTLTGTNNFDTNIALTVSGYSPGSTVQFSPPQVDPVEGPVTSTLTVHTPAGLFAQSTPSTHLWPMATPALALLLLLPFRRWRNAFRGKLLLLVVALASLATAAALTGCGGGFALPQTSQSYTLTITGTGGSDNHSTTVQLTVQ
jgi:multisubunit Na+/H+ antiporter MnhE subunit